MARSPKGATTTAGSITSTISTPTSTLFGSTTIATRKSTRRQSISSTTPSTPFTSGPLTPADSSINHPPILIASPAGTSSLVNTPGSKAPLPPSRQPVEARTHALRSIGGGAERVASPFPGQYGGKDKCAVVDEDEVDEVLMAICSACASTNNRALSPEDIARIAYNQGWLRPPTAAVEPTSIINTAIRTHLKRCEKAIPPRQPLLSKQQLTGSVNESVVEPALHPDAFNNGIRPKGTYFYLATVGKMKWKSPFDGIEIPKPPPRKPAPPKSKVKKESSGGSKDKKKDMKESGKIPKVNLKIRLVVNPQTQEDIAAADGEADESEEGGSSSRSRSLSRSRSAAPLPLPPTASIQPISLGHAPKRVTTRRPSHIDSSSGSDTSDSETEIRRPGPSRLPSKPKLMIRKSAPIPSPITIGASPRLGRIGSFGRGSQASPFRDLFFPSPQSVPLPAFAPPHSPFPTHSLDNTTWAARNELDRYTAFETSSSSSDDELREPDWGQTSEILIRAAEATEEQGSLPPVWTVEDEEKKVKEATEALRVLFPMSSPDEDAEMRSTVELNQLDNRMGQLSDLSSVTDSTSTATAQAISRGQLKARHASDPIAFESWGMGINSSPGPSPSVHYATLAPDSSPVRPMSRLESSFGTDHMDMEVDEGNTWLDDELPVRADDSMSDIELNSMLDDASTPEHDRHQHTADWARQAAAAAGAAFAIKDEPDDYPSPLSTDPGDDQSLSEEVYHHTRSFSTPSQTPSSCLSDAPPSVLDGDLLDGPDPEDPEVGLGPESISIDEIDGWMPNTKRKTRDTPTKRNKGRCQSARCSGNWGSIGVGSITPILPIHPSKMAIKSESQSPQRRQSLRNNSRRRQSSPFPVVSSPHSHKASTSNIPTSPLVESKPFISTSNDPFVLDIDAIGTADLERARAEAEASEERRRKECKEKAEKQKAILEAYRKKINETPSTIGVGGIDMDLLWDQPTPHYAHGGSGWPEMTWGSTSVDSLSPMVLHSVSTLSLGDMPHGVDPKELLSPPLSALPLRGIPTVSASTSASGPTSIPVIGDPAGSGQSNLDVDELMSPAEVEAVMISLSPSPPVPAVVPPSIPTTATSMKPSTSQQGFRPLLPASMQVSPPSLAPPITTTQVVNGTGASSGSLATSLTINTLPNKETSPSIESELTPLPSADPSQPVTPNNELSQTDQPRPQTGKTIQPVTTNIPLTMDVDNTSPPLSAASSSTTTGSTATAKQPFKGRMVNLKNGSSECLICPGVRASVLDNIPVYKFFWKNKDGFEFPLLRRLDSDFVNGTSLLVALGIEPSRHPDYIARPSPYLPAHQKIPEVSADGKPYSTGVNGCWIPWAEAYELAHEIHPALFDEPSPMPGMSNLLRSDLFQFFAQVAKYPPQHSPSESFGSPFVAGKLRQNGGAPPLSNQASANTASAVHTAKSLPPINGKTTATSGNIPIRNTAHGRNNQPPANNTNLSTSTANSKSTPNLTALGLSSSSGPVPQAGTGTAPGVIARTLPPALAAAKGPLIRSAPATPPEGCPQPKRRRATVVGDSPLTITPITPGPLPFPTPGNGPAGGRRPILPAGPDVAGKMGNPHGAGNANVSAAARRATRASLGGEMPKPKVSRA